MEDDIPAVELPDKLVQVGEAGEAAATSRGDDEVLEGVAIGDTIEEVYSSESDEGEEGIVIHAGRTTSRGRPHRKSFGKNMTYTRPDALSPHSLMSPGTAKSASSSGAANVDEELKKLRFLRHATAFDVDVNALEDHPWRSKTVDLLDYFNYGFNERTWLIYCEKQLRLRAQKGLGPYQPPPGAPATVMIPPGAASQASASLAPAPAPAPPVFPALSFLPPAAPAAVLPPTAAPKPIAPSFPAPTPPVFAGVPGPPAPPVGGVFLPPPIPSMRPLPPGPPVAPTAPAAPKPHSASLAPPVGPPVAPMIAPPVAPPMAPPKPTGMVPPPAPVGFGPPAPLPFQQPRVGPPAIPAMGAGANMGMMPNGMPGNMDDLFRQQQNANYTGLGGVGPGLDMYGRELGQGAGSFAPTFGQDRYQQNNRHERERGYGGRDWDRDRDQRDPRDQPPRGDYREYRGEQPDAASGKRKFNASEEALDGPSKRRAPSNSRDRGDRGEADRSARPPVPPPSSARAPAPSQSGDRRRDSRDRESSRGDSRDRRDRDRDRDNGKRVERESDRGGDRDRRRSPDNRRDPRDSDRSRARR